VYTSGNGNNRTPQPKNWWVIIKEAVNKLVKHFERNTTLYLVGIVFLSVELILFLFIVLKSYSFYFNDIISELQALKRAGLIETTPGWPSVGRLADNNSHILFIQPFILLSILTLILYIYVHKLYIKEIKWENIYFMYYIITVCLILLLLYISFPGVAHDFLLLVTKLYNWLLSCKHTILIYGLKHTNFVLIQGIPLLYVLCGVICIIFIIGITYKITNNFKQFFISLFVITFLLISALLYLKLTAIQIFINIPSDITKLNDNIFMIPWNNMKKESLGNYLTLSLLMTIWSICSGFFIRAYYNNVKNATDFFFRIGIGIIITNISLLLLVMCRPYEISSIIAVVIGIYNFLTDNQYRHLYRKKEFCIYTFYSGYSIKFLLVLLLLSVVSIIILFFTSKYTQNKLNTQLDDKKQLIYCIVYVLIFVCLFLLLGYLFSSYCTASILHYIKVE
jgi:hypothetical protein